MRLFFIIFLIISSFFSQFTYSKDANYYDLIKLKLECSKDNKGKSGYSNHIWFIANDYNLLGSTFWTHSDKKRGIGKKVFTGTWSKNGLIIHGKGSYTDHKSNWKFYFNSKGNIPLIEHLKKGVEGSEGEGSGRRKCSFMMLDKLDLSKAIQVDNYIFRLKTVTNNYNLSKKQKLQLETDNNELETKNKDLESQISVLIKQNEQVSIANTSNANTIKDLMEDLNNTKSSLKSTKSSLNKESDKIKELENLIEKENQEKTDLGKKLNTSLAKQAQFVEDQKQSQQSLDAKTNEITDLQNKIKALENLVKNQNQNQQSLDAKTNEITDLQNKIDALENVIDNQQQTQEQFNVVINDLKQKQEEMTLVNSDLISSNADLLKSLSAKEQIIVDQGEQINSLNLAAQKNADEEAELKKKEFEQKQAELKAKQDEAKLAELAKEEKINYAKFNALFELMGGDKKQKLANYIFNGGFNNSSDQNNNINVKVFDSNQCIIGWEDQWNGYLKVYWQNIDFELIDIDYQNNFIEVKLSSKNEKNVAVVNVKSNQIPENYQSVLEKQNLYPPNSTEAKLTSINIPLAETSKYEQYLLEGSLKKLITEICE